MIAGYFAYHLSMILSTIFAIDINNKSNSKKLASKILIVLAPILSLSVLVVLSGFRYNVGTDYSNYELIFQLISKDLPSLVEPGYETLNKLFIKIEDGVLYVFLIMSFVTYLLVYITLKRESILMYGVFFMSTFSFVFISNNIIRQAFCIALFFWSIKYIYEQKLIKYVFTILIGSLFHGSIIILLPFYFLKNINFPKFIWILMIIISSILSFTGVINIVLTNIVPMFTKYSNYLEMDYGSSIKSGLTNVLYGIMYIYIVLFEHVIKSLKERTYLNIFLIGINLNFVFMTVDFLSRISFYFIPMFMLVLPMLFKNMENNIVLLVTKVIFILLSLLLWYKAMILNDHGCMPYNNWLIL